MYLEGKGVPQDYGKALKWFRGAAAKGFAGAQYYLGFMYERGKGVGQDYGTALKWYRLAADQGLVIAQLLSGSCTVTATA